MDFATSVYLNTISFHAVHFILPVITPRHPPPPHPDSNPRCCEYFRGIARKLLQNYFAIMGPRIFAIGCSVRCSLIRHSGGGSIEKLSPLTPWTEVGWNGPCQVPVRFPMVYEHCWQFTGRLFRGIFFKKKAIWLKKYAIDFWIKCGLVTDFGVYIFLNIRQKGGVVV